MAKTIDMIGFQSGLLTVIDTAPPQNGARWQCQCQCGNVIIAKGSKLRGKDAPKSCGCERTRKLIEQNKVNNIKDITNQIFGTLTALEPTFKRQGKAVIWKCICECGAIVEVSGADLRSGNTKSCGCQRNKSFGEEKIALLLKEHNISFVREKAFNDLTFNTNYSARFDFFVLDSYIIEYDGRQHYVEGVGVYDNHFKFIKTQQHDKIKNDYCKSHNIPIIRIPYTEINNLTIEMLKPETSKYLLQY